MDARIAVRCLTMLFCSFTKEGIRQWRPPDPFVESFGRLTERQIEDHAEACLQVVSAGQARVGLHDPGEFCLLLLGQVLRVLPEGIAAVLDASSSSTIWAGRSIGSGSAAIAAGIVVPGGCPGLVPRGPADVVEGFGGPFHDVERISAPNGVGRSFRDNTGDPSRTIRGHMRDLGRPFGP